jgi:tetratricopeptide (TPR) repeat protein
MTPLNEQTKLLRQVRLALQHNDFTLAIQSLNQVIALAEEKDDWGAVARHLGNLALAYYRSGDPQRSVESFARGIQLARRENDKLTENGLLGNMGNVLREMGHLDEAMQYLNQALYIAEELNDVRGRGIWLSHLGLVYDDLKQASQAYELHAQSVDVARQLQDAPNLASRLGNMGNSLVALQQLEEALQHFQEAVDLYTELGRKEDSALRLGIMGNIYATLGRNTSPNPIAFQHFANALEKYQASATVARELSDYITEAELLRSMGNVLVEIGRYSDALDYFNAANFYFTQLNLPHKVQQLQQTLEALRRYMNTRPQ